MLLDLTADVYRTHVGEIVRWQAVLDVHVGRVVGIAIGDSVTDSGNPRSKSGQYFGRLVTIDCQQSLCDVCNVPGRPPGFRDEWGNRWWGHYADECQLSFAGQFPILENAPELNGALF